MAGNTILFVIMGICGVFMALPLVMILNNALKPLDELFRYPPQIFVRNPSLDNFSDLYVLMSSSWVPFTRYVLNTLIITGLGTVGHVLFASLAAYPLAKHDFPGKKFLFSMVVLSLMFSYNVTAIPNYMIISWLGINNTYLAVILPAFAYGLGLYLMKQFMEQLPDSLLEAARIDGCSYFRTYWNVLLPLVKPGLTTLAILGMLNTWKDLMWPLINNSQADKMTLAAGLAMLIGEHTTYYEQVMAGGVIAVLPLIVLFVIFQRQFVQGIAHSGIKG